MSQAGLAKKPSGFLTTMTIDGDTGSATGSVITLTALNGADNSGSTVNFAASGSKVVFNVTDSNGNTIIGSLAGNGSLTGLQNTGFGRNVFQSLTNGLQNVAIGQNALLHLTNGAENNAIGSATLANLTTGSFNTGIGDDNLGALTTGSYNATFGAAAGNNYTTNESSNILLNNRGIAGESNTLRIGVATGTGNQQLSTAFISGIANVNVGSTANVVSINTANDQLGTTAITAGTGISITSGANTITISATGTTTLNYTAVSSSPYVVVATDDFLGVTTSTIAITVQLPNAPATGRVFTIKDATGNAATNNITVTTVGGVVTIDGATSYVMNTAFESINVLFNGTSYLIF